MKLTIHNYGDPVLREKAEAIDSVDEEIRTLASAMVETMHAQAGIGLAAQQVGRTIALCVVDLPPEMDTNEEGQPDNPDVVMPMTLLNPVSHDLPNGKWTREEGCLSFPEITGNIERPWSVHVTYMNLDGNPHEQVFHGMLARVVQHEIDHLNGVLFVDRMSHVKKLALKGRLRRLRQETEEALG